MKYDVIILNYNNLDKLAMCIESIKLFSNHEPNITVIDNGSQERVVEWCALKGVTCEANKGNKLYTIPYSEYIAKNKVSEYFVLMNNDTVVTAGWDAPLIEFMQSNTDCGIVAPMLTDITGRQVQNMGGLQDFCSHKADTISSWKAPEKSTWTTFACVMIRKEAYEKVKGFDTQFLFYCSDSDLCLRMKLEGYDTYNVPASKVRHYHSLATQQMGRQIQQVGREDQMRFDKKWERHGIKIGNKDWFVRRTQL